MLPRYYRETARADSHCPGLMEAKIKSPRPCIEYMYTYVPALVMSGDEDAECNAGQ